MERDRYCYQKFCSDLAGQDSRAHDNAVEDALRAVRDWLRKSRDHATSPGPKTRIARYLAFRRDLPRMCRAEGVSITGMLLVDYRTFVVAWLEENPRMA